MGKKRHALAIGLLCFDHSAISRGEVNLQRRILLLDSFVENVLLNSGC
jgi:hypothetical protein